MANLESLSIPQLSDQDKELLKNRQANLLRSRDQLVGDSMANVANTATIGSGPQSMQPNLAAGALAARGQQKFQGTLNDILQKQKYASFAKRGQNLAQAQNESLQQADRMAKQYDITNRLNLNKNALEVDNFQTTFDEVMSLKYDRLAEEQARLNKIIYLENKEKKAREEYNSIVRTILGGAGTVFGALAGGGTGAVAGAGAGSALGTAST